MVYLFAAVTVFVLAAAIWEYINAKNKVSYLVKNLGILAVVVVFLFLFGPFFILSPLKLGYDAMEENGVTLFYPKKGEGQAGGIMKICQEAVFANAKFFQERLEPKILLAMSDFDMLRFGANPKAAGAGLPWGINVKAGKTNYSVVAHEMSHLALQKITKRSSLFFPRWFDEGLASYLGKMDYYRNLEDLKYDIYENRFQNDLINWRGLVGLLKWQNIIFFDPHRNVSQVYGQSYQMVKYLVEKYDTGKINLLLETCKILPFDQAFEKVYGFSEKDFANKFLKFVQK